MLYCVLSPMNWIPGIPLGFYNAAKIGLFILLTLLSFFLTPMSSPSRLLSFKGLMLVLFVSSYAFINAYNSNTAYESLKDICLPFVIILIIYNYQGSNEQLLSILYKAALVVGIVCFLSLISYLTGYFDFNPPAPFKDSFSSTAFGGYRTGWSNSVFLFVPFIIFYSLHKEGKLNGISILLLLGILSSQFLSGGRAGLLSSLICIAVFSLKRLAIILPIVMLACIIYFYLPENILTEKFRTDPKIVARGKSLKFMSDEEYVDGLTSNRIIGYKIGFELFLGSPLIGYGFGQSDPLSDQMGYSPDIHNVWLKRMIEGGLLLFFILASIFYNAHKHIKKKLKNLNTPHTEREYVFWFFFRTLFYLALAISMVEPNYLIGSIQGEAIFWISLAFLLRDQNYE